jgi:ABC-type Co2+ transport system permease subunit
VEDASAGSSRETRERAANLRIVGLWLILALAGVSVPYILKGGLAPPWIEWLIRGTGGQGQAWQAMGYICGIFALIEFMRWGGERSDKPLLGRAAAWLSLLLGAGFVVLAVGFVVLLGSLFLSVLIAPLSYVLPEQIGIYLRNLDRGPGAFILSGAIAALMAGTGVAVYFRTRRIRAEGASTDDVIAEAIASFSPFFFLNDDCFKCNGRVRYTSHRTPTSVVGVPWGLVEMGRLLLGTDRWHGDDVERICAVPVALVETFAEERRRQETAIFTSLLDGILCLSCVWRHFDWADDRDRVGKSMTVK